ncbi:MAG: 30S ribosomal protein S18 [Bacilli bacterium]|jgi:small subunit ribosomal protein S18|nr:30S ribosomal protein S18 [Bacilli bacterium]MBR1718486.1 30S ribosomal protein S18 [Bacilli bacterium]
MAEFYRKKKKICQMCAGKDVNYKDADIIKKYVSADKGKILPRRVTGACAKHQRYIANEVKKARFMAILPFVK